MRFPAGSFWITLPLATLGSFLLFTSLRGTSSRPSPRPEIPALSTSPSAYMEEEVIIPPAETNPEVSIQSAVDWLLRHQFADGMWSAASFTQMCPKVICGGSGSDRYDVAVTALALWALLDSGLIHETRVRQSAREALGWLKKYQEERCEWGATAMYSQAISTIAFCRGFEVLGDPSARAYAGRGIGWMEEAQNRNGGWGYRSGDGRSDSSVTAWVAHAVLSAEQMGMKVSLRARTGTLAWFDEVTDSHYYQVSYRRRGEGGSVFVGRNEQYEPNGALTAFATFVRSKWGMDRHDPRIREAVRSLSWNLPVWNRSRSSVDFNYWYGGTMAMTVAGKSLRELWFSRIQRLLGRYQVEGGCSSGSWNPEDKWGCDGGRVYATALNILTIARSRK